MYGKRWLNATGYLASSCEHRATVNRTPPTAYRSLDISIMTETIDLRLFATLQQFNPDNTTAFPITPGTTVRDVLATINVPVEKAKLIFVDGLKKDLDEVLNGGERVGIFPPVGGG